MPFNSVISADTRLRNPAPLTEQEIQDLMEWMPFLSTGSVRRLEAESALKLLKAIKQFDESSGKISKWGLWLNVALFVLTVMAVFIAVESYRDANRSSNEQSKILKDQKDALNASRGALESAVTVMQTQKGLLEQSVKNSQSQLKISQEQYRREVEKPDVEAFFVYPQIPSLLGHNKSNYKAARNVIYEGRFWNLAEPTTEGYRLKSTIVGTFDAMRPGGLFGPNPLQFSPEIPVKPLGEDTRIFGYVTLQCPDCQSLHLYWLYVEIGKYGVYREGTLSDFDFYHIGPNGESKALQFINNGKVLTSMPMKYP